MNVRLCVLGITAVLGGCASVGEPIPLGDNKYRLNSETHPFMGGSESALRQSIDTAKKFCVQQGKESEVTRVGEGSFGRATIHFKCH